MDWYEQQTSWSEPHGYGDPKVTTPELLAWYAEMRLEFPNLNGPGAAGADVDSEKLADYSIGSRVIYAAFQWPKAEAAYNAVRRLAEKHRTGFYDVSGADGEIWFPPA